MGFVSPQEIWQKEALKDEFDRVFKEIKKKAPFDFLDKNQIYKIYQEYIKGNFQDWLIWRVYVCLSGKRFGGFMRKLYYLTRSFYPYQKGAGH